MATSKGVDEEGDEIGLRVRLFPTTKSSGARWMRVWNGTVPERDCIVNIIEGDYMDQASLGDA